MRVALGYSIEERKMIPAPVKELITYKDFEKLDIRVGRIIQVSEVKESDKLMKLTVDFGDHVRSILAGIRQERENPYEIEGKQALFVVNLPERKMAGEVSQGMLFDIGYADKLAPCLAIPEVEMPNGSRAG
jgi:tRNA-binding protein